MRSGVLRRQTLALSRHEWISLALLVAVAVAPFVAMLAPLEPGGTLTGAQGMFPSDQLQYEAWIRDAASNGLASSLYGLEATGHVLLHPLWTLSGGLVALGVPVQVAFLVWLPVAVALLFAACCWYVRRTLESPRARAGALALALFYFSPLMLVGDPWPAIDSLSQPYFRASWEAWTAGTVDGGFHVAIAIAVMVFTLRWSAALLDPARANTGTARRHVALAAGAALLTSWLHPWHGAILIGVLVGAALLERSNARAWTLAPVAAAATLPLVYYEVLSRENASWQLAHARGTLYSNPELLTLVAVGPLVCLAVLGLRRQLDRHDALLVLWPVVALVLYLVMQPPAGIHALQGIAVPLGILAARGLERLRPPRWAFTAALAVLIVPGVVLAARAHARQIDTYRAAYVLEPAERRAIAWLDTRPRHGGVVARATFSGAIPVLTGRRVWVGHQAWTPLYSARAARAEYIVRGRLDRDRLRRALAEIGAPFLLVDCSAPARRAVFESLATERIETGCAAAYEFAWVRSPAGG